MHLLCWGCLIQSSQNFHREKKKRISFSTGAVCCITIFFLNKGHSKLKGKSRGHVLNSLISISLTLSHLKNVLTAQDSKKNMMSITCTQRWLKTALSVYRTMSYVNVTLFFSMNVIFSICASDIETGSIQNHRL